MQLALSCRSPLVTGGAGMAIPEQLEKPEVVNPVNIRVVGASKTDCGTPKRAAPSGSRLCPTPKSEMRTRASQTQAESLELDVVADLENEPVIVPNFTTYSNPAFELQDNIGTTPLKAPKQPPCIPVDSNGSRLCPTPKSTRSSTVSPGPSKLRFPKATAFQPLETIRSPAVSKDQIKRVAVLGDLNGQRTQETPKASKQVTTPRGGRPAATENIAPRALFNNVSSSQEASNVKKRARAGEVDEVTRTTRSKTEVEKIATFLRSPAARVRPDGTREEYRLGVSGDELVKKFMEKKMMMEKGCQCGPTAECIGCAASVARSPFVRTPSTASRISARTTTPQGSAKKNLSVLLEAQK